MEGSLYSLMLLDTAERIRDFESRDSALEALEKFVDAEPSLAQFAAVWEFEDGAPVGDPILIETARLILH